ncbi:hexokinase A [Phlyctochytrium planicorne]|nr:hexokinase A [Phlyctochytrium planicorne]
MDPPIHHITRTILLTTNTIGVAAAAAATFVVNTFFKVNGLNKSKAPRSHKAVAAASAVVAAAPLASDEFPQAVVELETMFNVPSDKLNQIVKHMVSEMKRGLQDDNHDLKMIPSHVVRRPKGTETGTFLALDLGGSNFRVCEVTLEGNGITRIRQKKFTVSEALKVGPGQNLFDFFADCVAGFLDETGSRNKSMKLGFTFSFPFSQPSISKGYLMYWTKGFSASGVEGADVGQLLQDAFARKGLNISVTALVNDTTGTLISHAYSQPNTCVGVILGTGTNAAYVEQVENIVKLKDPVLTNEMVINTEWGAFDEEHIVLPRTKYDLKVDRGSTHPRLQTFEKLISGLYLGEVVRYVMIDLIKTGIIFGGVFSTQINTPYSFDTAYMSRIERDHTLDLSDTKIVLEDTMGIPKTTRLDRQIIRAVCELVGRRSARLAAAGVAAIVTKINRLDGCTIAIDGSLFELYPHYANRMRDALREILGISAENIVLEQARDGSGQGAALIAALAEMVQAIRHILQRYNFGDAKKHSIGSGYNLARDVSVPLDYEPVHVVKSPDGTTSANMILCGNETASSIFRKFDLSDANHAGHLFGVFKAGGDFEFINRSAVEDRGGVVTFKVLFVYETRSESISADEVLDRLRSAGDLYESTHAVTKVVYGGYAACTFECPLEAGESYVRIFNVLQSELQSAFGIAQGGMRSSRSTCRQYLGRCKVTVTGTLNEGMKMSPKNAVDLVSHLRESIDTFAPIRYEMVSLESLMPVSCGIHRLNLVSELLSFAEKAQNHVKEAELAVLDFLSKFSHIVTTRIQDNFMEKKKDMLSKMARVLRGVKRLLGPGDEVQEEDEGNDRHELELFASSSSRLMGIAKALRGYCEQYEGFIARISSSGVEIVTDDRLSDFVGRFKTSYVFTEDFNRQEESADGRSKFYKLMAKFKDDHSKNFFVRIAEDYFSSKEVKGIQVPDAPVHDIVKFEATLGLRNWHLTKQCRALTSAHVKCYKENRMKVSEIPPNLRHLQIPCQQRGCSADPRRWLCKDCYEEFLFDADGFLYCNCKKAKVKVHNCSFLCMEGNHMSTFADCLDNLSLDDIVIGIVGAAGIGKTTLINSIVNYFKFRDLDHAVNNPSDLVFQIPGEFRADGYGVLQPDGSIVPESSATIKFGDESTYKGKENINHAGEASTQVCTPHQFVIHGRNVIFIDCPGAVDPRGVATDDKNSEHIVKFVSGYKHLSAILFVMKPNETRLNSSFMYGFVQTLGNFNKKLADNIFLAFTTSSTTNFAIAGTKSTLEQLQERLSTPDSPLNLMRPDRMFFVDSNGFRLACAYAAGYVLSNDKDGELYNSARKDWRRSSEAIKALINALFIMPPISTQGVSDLSKVKIFISNIAYVLMKIARSIDDNVAAIEAKKIEVKKKEKLGEDLQKELMVEARFAKVIPLEKPRTVCTNPTCSRIISTDKVSTSDQIQHDTCHDHCHVEAVTLNVINHPHLEHCAVMKDRHCLECASRGHTCSVEMHMHMVTDVVFYTEVVEVEEVRATLEKNAAEMDQYSKAQAALDAKKRELEAERDEITKTCALCVAFILNESLVAPNDAIIKHLETDISLFERLPDKTPSQEKYLENLKALKKKYEEELKLLKTYQKTVAPIDAAAAKIKVEGLYNLKYSGAEIKDCVEKLTVQASGRTEAANANEFGTVYNVDEQKVPSDLDTSHHSAGPTKLEDDNYDSDKRETKSLAQRVNGFLKSKMGWK